MRIPTYEPRIVDGEIIMFLVDGGEYMRTTDLTAAVAAKSECVGDHSAQKNAGWDHCPICKAWL